MLSRWRVGLLPLLVCAAAAVVAACTGGEGSPSNDGSDGEGSDEQDLVALELKCESTDQATKFDVSPGLGGAVIEGKLSFPNGSSSASSMFVCREPAGGGADAGSTSPPAGLVVSCNERPQSIHSGQWKVEVTKTGIKYAATIKRGADSGADQVLSCTQPARPGDGGAVPTYAQVKPLIDGKCNGCHANTFNTLAKVKQRKNQMIAVISSGSMPRGNSNWRNTDDGKKVLDFLRNSNEL
jgi:hypothetical protein